MIPATTMTIAATVMAGISQGRFAFDLLGSRGALLAELLFARLAAVAGQGHGVSSVRIFTRAVSADNCSATRSGAVPPTPARLAIERGHREAGADARIQARVDRGVLVVVGSSSSSPCSSQNRTSAPAISWASRNGTPCRTS